MRCNEFGGGFFTVILIPHGDPLLDGLVRLHQVEARFKNGNGSPQLRSGEIKT